MLALLTGLILASAGPASGAEPMLDGRCDEYGAPRFLIQNRVGVHFRDTTESVWLCFSLPQDSFASTDLRVDSPGLSKALNLHASAQLGEWTDRPPTQPDWGNNLGWTANLAPFAGVDGAGRARFAAVQAREFQLSKSRFGAGSYRLSVTIDGVGGPATGKPALTYSGTEKAPWQIFVANTQR